MSRIEGRGCAQKGKRERWRVRGILVLLVILLFSGVADADYPLSPFGNWTSYTESDSPAKLSWDTSVYPDRILFAGCGATCNFYNGDYAKLTQTITVPETKYYVISGYEFGWLPSNARTNVIVNDTVVCYYGSYPYGTYNCGYTFPAGTYNFSVEIRWYTTIGYTSSPAKTVNVFDYNAIPNITSWSNNKTNDAIFNLTVLSMDNIKFNATADQTVTTWNWYKNNTNQNNNYNNFTTNFIAGNHTIKVNATNIAGTSNTITWNIVSQVITSCPVGWCYLGSNYTIKTLLELDNLFTTNTITGRYNSTSKKYESKRAGYAFNQNVTAYQKEGIYYYFSSPQNIPMTPGTTPSITLKQGWSLTSNYGVNARTLAELKSSIGANATSAKYYDKVLKAFVSTDSQLVPAMESFFIYCSESTVWNN